MKILVDTCTFLWLAADDPALSAEVRDACSDPTNEVYLSAISAWEIAIKHRLGRLPLPEPPTAYVSSRRQWLRLEACPFDERSAAHTSVLPRHPPRSVRSRAGGPGDHPRPDHRDAGSAASRLPGADALVSVLGVRRGVRALAQQLVLIDPAQHDVQVWTRATDGGCGQHWHVSGLSRTT